jgi:hypothetical protein
MPATVIPIKPDAADEAMYSTEWFETYAATVPASIIEADLRGITATLPLDRYPRILDVGCGIGRSSESRPSPDFPRYQLICTRPE